MRPAGDTCTASLAVAVVEISVVQVLDVGGVPAFSELLDRVLALEPRELVVDLAGCESLDAAAINVLLDAHRRLWCADGVLMLRTPAPRVRRLLSLARADRVLRIAATASGAEDPL